MSKLWPKYKNWSKLETEHHMYRYNPNMYRYMLAQNDQNLTCTGTCSMCTGTCDRKCPECVFFSHFSIFFPPNSTLYFIHTSKPFHIHLEISFLLNVLSILILFQRPIMNYFKTHFNMDYDPYSNQNIKIS